MEPLPKVSLQQIPCPDCGSLQKVATIGGLTIKLCVHCRDQMNAKRQAQGAAESETRRFGEALLAARLPVKYQVFSLAPERLVECGDLPSRSEWPAGITWITSASERVVVDRLRAWVPHAGDGWVMLEGPPGQGKSHLVAAWCRDLITNGRHLLWLSEREVALLAAADFKSAAKREANELLHRACTCPLLIWDDFGFTGRRDLSANVLGLRYERCLPTVLTTNLDKKARQAFVDAPTGSRLTEMLSPARGGWHAFLEGVDKRRVR